MSVVLANPQLPMLDSATDVGWWMNVFDALPDATFITYADTGRIQVANKASENLLGFDLSEILGKTTMDLGMFLNKRQRDKIVFDCLATGDVVESPFFAKNRVCKKGQFSIREVTNAGKRMLIIIVREIDFEYQLKAVE